MHGARLTNFFAVRLSLPAVRFALAGMLVTFARGLRVARSVIGETRGGGLVQGVNNAKADAGVVNERNLIGVIVRTYASTVTRFRGNLTRQLALHSRPPVSAMNHI